MARGLAALFIVTAVGSAWAGPRCEAFNVSDSDLKLDPPADMIDVCSRDSELCQKLTNGYPPSVKTLAYFVTMSEWKEYQAGKRLGFSRYLIGQEALGMTSSAFGGLKDFIRLRQGDMPDNSTLPAVLQSTGRVNLGVLEESTDAIVVGVVSKVQSPAPGPQEIILASSNVALLSRERVLSLYVFVDITRDSDYSPMRQLTDEWLGCIREANKL